MKTHERESNKNVQGEKIKIKEVMKKQNSNRKIGKII